MQSEPNQIKEYYIAYFDILGYKDFFQHHADRASEFLALIHDAIEKTNEFIQDKLNQWEPLTNINIKIKVFSDNVLMCMEVGDKQNEVLRAFGFIYAVVEVQKGFVLQDELFIRGGLTKGELSFNENYVFGQGLIDAVELEKASLYPRIVVADTIINIIRSISIENDRINTIMNHLISKWIRKWADETYYLSYLYHAGIYSFISNEEWKRLKENLPDDYPVSFSINEYKDNSRVEFKVDLKRHKDIVENKLKEFGSNSELLISNKEEAAVREYVLKKYIWVMAYHNEICASYNMIEYGIQTNCNLDKRFLRTVVTVID